jgi:hypothetical protein
MRNALLMSYLGSARSPCSCEDFCEDSWSSSSRACGGQSSQPRLRSDLRPRHSSTVSLWRQAKRCSPLPHAPTTPPSALEGRRTRQATDRRMRRWLRGSHSSALPGESSRLGWAVWATRRRSHGTPRWRRGGCSTQSTPTSFGTTIGRRLGSTAARAGAPQQRSGPTAR